VGILSAEQLPVSQGRPLYRELRISRGQERFQLSQPPSRISYLLSLSPTSISFYIHSAGPPTSPILQQVKGQLPSPPSQEVKCLGLCPQMLRLSPLTVPPPPSWAWVSSMLAASITEGLARATSKLTPPGQILTRYPPVCIH